MTIDLQEAARSQKMIEMMSAYWVSQAIYASAKLGIADLLRDGPRSIEELAQAADTHGEALYRLMRALASVDIFKEIEDRRFSLTPLAERLRSDHPFSLRDLTIMWSELQYHAWGDVVYSIKTGQCAYDHRHDASFFELLAKNADVAQTFSLAMTSFMQSVPESIVDFYDFSGFSKIIDVGAAHGTLLSAILSANKNLHGVLFDLPQVVESAKAHIEASGLSSRCTSIGGSFLESVPRGGDLYILSEIIHDWDDERSIKILKNCRDAIAPDGKLLLIELVIKAGNEPFFGKWLDLHMLVMHGGHDRTETEYQRLLEAAGFKLKRLIPTNFLRSVIEAVPV